jgi:basic membrane protein A
MIMAVLFTGCSSGTSEPKLLMEWTVETAQEAASVQETGKKYRVGMITDIGGVKDQGFNQSAWEGLLAFHELTGAVTTFLESDTTEDFAPNLSALVENGYTLCWGVGYQCADAVLAVAEEYPEVNFAVIDNEYEDAPENVTSVVFRAQEPSFVVGYIAARVTKTGKVGFVGGAQSDIIDQFHYGYLAGVAYANQEQHTNVEAFVQYVGDFVDDKKGEELANEMYADGCDIIYAAAGGAGLGVIRSAGETDHFVIGVDKDQVYLDPKHILTSGMKKVDIAILRVSQEYTQGIDIGGRTLSFGMTEGAVGIPEGHENYADEIYDDAIALCDLIKAGKLIPPMNEEQYLAFISKL